MINTAVVSIFSGFAFMLATILVTIFAAYMERDPTMQVAYSASLFLTLPMFGLVGLGFGLWLALG